MFHKNVADSFASVLPSSKDNPQRHHVPGLSLVPAAGSAQESSTETPDALPIPASFDLVGISARRCSSFFAEAAVLVLVFGVLDYFLQKGHIGLMWIGGALSLSLALLAASIATDFGAQRWIRAHP